MSKQIKIISIVSGVSLVLATAILLLMGMPKESGNNTGPSQVKPPEIKTTEVETKDSSILVSIDDKSFTESEVFGPDMVTYFEMKQKEYDFKQSRFRRFLAAYYLKEKADEKGLSIDDYVAKYIVKGKDFTPTQAEIDAFIRDRNIPMEEVKNNPEAAGQIKEFLKFKKQQDIVENQISAWSKNKKIQLHFKAPVLNIDIPDLHSPVFGNAQAKVTIVEFSDFECPYCARASSMIKEIKNKYKSKIKLVYKHMPLEIHPNARMLAKASICVEQLNKPSFWLFYDELFKNQGLLMDKKMSVEDIVAKLKLSKTDFQQCMLSEAPDQLIEMDVQLGQQLGVGATPTFFINGRVVQGAVPFQEMSRIIEEELAKVKE